MPTHKEAIASSRERAKTVAEDLSGNEIHARVKQGTYSHVLFSFASFIVIFAFLFFWWTGANLEVSEWSSGDKGAAFMAFVVAVGIATGQFVLYPQDMSLKILLFSKLGILVLCVIADIGVNLDREDARVSRLSEQSPVLQSMLKSAENPIQFNSGGAIPPVISKAMEEKREALVWINSRCASKHKRAGSERIQQCKEFEQGRLQAAESTIAGYEETAGIAAASATKAAMSERNKLYAQAKEKEKDPENHHGLVRFAMVVLSLVPITASVLVSMIVMVPLELMFIANGKALAINKIALNMKLGAQGANGNALNANSDFDIDLRNDTLDEIQPESQGANPQKKSLNLVPINEIGRLAALQILEGIASENITAFTTRIIKDQLNELGFGKNDPERQEIYNLLEDFFEKEGYISLNEKWVIPPAGEAHKNGRMQKWFINLAICKEAAKNITQKDLRVDTQGASLQLLTS